MASVLLPTREWTPSCAVLTRQLEPEDELLVLCDDPTDPVAQNPPRASDDATIHVVPVGDPVGCSGKAHALAVGLERTEQNLVVMTDDDVERDAEWLTTLKRLASERGAASVTPIFVGTGPWWYVFEPAMITFGSALLCRYGGVWGGGVAFERDRIDEKQFRRDLERTVSDDALLWDCLDDVYTTPALVNVVRVPGDAASVRDRIRRFVLTYRYWLPRATGTLWVLSLVVVALTVLAPLVAAASVTLCAVRAYRYLGVGRRTWLLALPSVLTLSAVIPLVWFDPVFEWGGRRYQWQSRFDTVVENADQSRS